MLRYMLILVLASNLLAADTIRVKIPQAHGKFYFVEGNKQSLQGIVELNGDDRLGFYGNNRTRDHHLKKMTHLPLQAIHLSSSLWVTDHGVAAIARIRTLQKLSLGGRRITDRSLKILKALPDLRSLALSHVRVRGEGFRYLIRKKSLTSISITASHFDIKDTTLQYLSKLRQLTFLSIGNCEKITDKGFLYLSRLSKLKELELSGAKVSNRGLTYLSRLKSLEVLSMRNSFIVRNYKPTGLTQLAACPKLKKLYLGGCACVTNETLRYIAYIPSLQELNVSYCSKITNEGLPHLAKLKLLRTLWVQRCKRITAAGINRLKTDLPKLRVYQ